jgi:hypothetical protein
MSALDEFLEAMRGLSAEDAFRLFMKHLEAADGGAAPAALGLREKAAAGELDSFAGAIPILEACLPASPDDETLLHVARALAAFGRRAQSAAPALVVRMAEVNVVDDITFHVFEGTVRALGYLGGDFARDYLAEIAAESPSRAAASSSVYQGALSEAEREAKLQRALAESQALLEVDSPTWRDLAPTGEIVPRRPKQKFWTLR